MNANQSPGRSFAAGLPDRPAGGQPAGGFARLRLFALALSDRLPENRDDKPRPRPDRRYLGRRHLCTDPAALHARLRRTDRVLQGCEGPCQGGRDVDRLRGSTIAAGPRGATHSSSSRQNDGETLQPVGGRAFITFWVPIDRSAAERRLTLIVRFEPRLGGRILKPSTHILPGIPSEEPASPSPAHSKRPTANPPGGSGDAAGPDRAPQTANPG